jgi:hypothetical protein
MSFRNPFWRGVVANRARDSSLTMARCLEILEMLRCTAVAFVMSGGDYDGYLHEMVALVDIERYVKYMPK